MGKNILIIAGEPSGDIRAGELLEELKKLLPDTSFWGIGGNHMAKHNVELITHIRKLSIIGVWEAVKHMPDIYKQYKNLVKNVRKKRPYLAILIDYPGFNLRIAKFLRQSKIPVVYYIIPQVWAWGHGRIKALKNYTDKIIVLFRFEKEFLDGFGIHSEFAGHPLLDESSMAASSSLPAPSTRARYTRFPARDNFTIALLPGSRKSEVEYMLPLLLETASKINERMERICFTIAETSNIGKNLYDLALSKYKSLKISRFTDDTFSCLASSDFAIVTSGTATLETAIMEKPMVIAYHTALFTYCLFRLFTNVPLIGLVNIIAGEEIAPEFLQQNATAEKLSQKVLEIINNEERMQYMQNKLREVKNTLGEKGASRRAAEVIHKFTKENL